MSTDSDLSAEQGGELPPIEQNEQGGMYVQGSRYRVEKRMHVLKSYFTILNECGKVVSTKLSEMSKVSTVFASKFIREFEAGRPVLGGKRVNRDSHPGISILDIDGELVLLRLYENDAQTPLHEYQEELLMKRGKLILLSTLD